MAVAEAAAVTAVAPTRKVATVAGIMTMNYHRIDCYGVYNDYYGDAVVASAVTVALAMPQWLLWWLLQWHLWLLLQLLLQWLLHWLICCILQ